MMNHYEILQIERDADAQTIKRAYFTAVKKHSPDKDPEGFKAIRTAYETLSEPHKRAEYDLLFVGDMSADMQSAIVGIKSLMDQNKYKLALEQVTEIEKKDKSSQDVAQFMRTKANILMRLGKTGLAERILKTLVEKDPKDYENLFLRAMNSLHRGHSYKCMEYFEAAADLMPNSHTFWNAYFAAISRERGMSDLRNAYQKVIPTYPDIFENDYRAYLIGIHVCYMRKDDYGDVIITCLERFANYFVKDKFHNESLIEEVMAILTHLISEEQKEYRDFIDKVIPILEASPHMTEDDVKELKEMKSANTNMGEWLKDRMDFSKYVSEYAQYKDLFDDDDEDDDPYYIPQQPFVRESRKIGRNEPCPCGSGKKYKKCCG